MAESHGWGGASHVGSNHPALAPPREGFSSLHPLLIQGGEFSRTHIAMYRYEPGQSALDHCSFTN